MRVKTNGFSLVIRPDGYAGNNSSMALVTTYKRYVFSDGKKLVVLVTIWNLNDQCNGVVSRCFPLGRERN